MELNLPHSKIIPRLADDDDSIVKLAPSGPPRFRRTGGFFDKCPLPFNGELYHSTHGSNAFNSRGTLKAGFTHYLHIKQMIRQEKPQRKELTPAPAAEPMLLQVPEDC